MKKLVLGFAWLAVWFLCATAWSIIAHADSIKPLPAPKKHEKKQPEKEVPWMRGFSFRAPVAPPLPKPVLVVCNDMGANYEGFQLVQRCTGVV